VPKPSRRVISVAIGAALPASAKAEAMEAEVRRLLEAAPMAGIGLAKTNPDGAPQSLESKATA
jgi:hypothetical protein